MRRIDRYEAMFNYFAFMIQGILSNQPDVSSAFALRLARLGLEEIIYREGIQWLDDWEWSDKRDTP